jgi:peptidyl-tRNA hydrolase
VTGEVLAPLRARYAHWLGLDDEQVLTDRDEAAEDVRALQLLLRMERDAPPSWHRALALAATGAAAVCLDPRSEPGGEWHEAVRDYCAGHIRKVTRRGRGAQYTATAELPGLSFDDAGTQVRALVPGRVVDLDKRVAKLQVGGTDAEVDVPAAETVGAPGPELRIWINPHHPMTLGKTMAQTGHAGMIAAALLATDPDALAAWIAAGLPARARLLTPSAWDELVGRLADPEQAWQQDRLLAVRDAGFTEVPAGTVTVAAHAPVSGLTPA